VQILFVNFMDMWDLKAFPGKFFRIRPTEVEFENNFSRTSMEIVIVPGLGYVVHVGNSSPQKSNKSVTWLKDQFTVVGSVTNVTSCPSTVRQCSAC